MASAIEGGVTAPLGFLAAGVAAGIKDTGKADVALIYTEESATCAGLFTRNIVKAAPVYFSQHVCEMGTARAVVANSGVANACTGERGNLDTVNMARRAAAAINAQRRPAAAIKADEILVASTGKIGDFLPMDKVESGIGAAAGELGREGGRAAAEAIMTTDTVAKSRAVELELSAGTVRIGGMAKGSGMIRPDMATMLAFITTDAAIESRHMKRLLRKAASPSFNSLTIDGQMSTNDSLMMLANGASGIELPADGPDNELFLEALTGLCIGLAREMAKDGEGATRLMTVTVGGCAEPDMAYHFARAIAESVLVKTAIYGRDANWGRIISAMGAVSANPEVTAATIMLNGVKAAERGMAFAYDEAAMAAALDKDEVEILVELPQGKHSWTVFSCDLTEEYIRINAEYRT